MDLPRYGIVVHELGLEMGRQVRGLRASAEMGHVVSIAIRKQASQDTVRLISASAQGYGDEFGRRIYLTTSLADLVGALVMYA